MRTRIPVLIALAGGAAALAACSDDIIAVKGRVADTAPEIGAFHAVLGSHALDVAALDAVPTDANGNFDLLFSDGEEWKGNVDLATGVFDARLTIPYDFLQEIHDAGTLELGSGLTRAAVYEEDFSYVDGSVRNWTFRFNIAGALLSLSAHERTRNVTVTGTTSYSNTRLDVFETWSRPDTFHEEVSTSYSSNGSGGEEFTQSWFRDDFATDVSPDRSANFDVRADGSGDGNLTWYYDHGITYSYAVTLATDGSYVENLLFEDPGTTVSPDGQGTFTFQPDYSGSGTYQEHYVDGSQMSLAETFARSGAEEITFAFDDASTGFAPDVDGTTEVGYDGSGTGTWNVHDATGIVETCTYDFDPTGAVSNLQCTRTSAATSSNASLGHAAALAARTAAAHVLDRRALARPVRH